jgi:hypothetical protein
MTAPEDQNGLREALAPCVTEALAEFQKRYGYHRPVIEELLIDFGEIVAGIANADRASLRAAEAEITRLKEGMEALGAALEPFAAFAEHMIDEHGWLDREHRASISTWFGPSQFRRAHQAFATLSPKEQP